MNKNQALESVKQDWKVVSEKTSDACHEMAGVIQMSQDKKIDKD